MLEVCKERVVHLVFVHLAREARDYRKQSISPSQPPRLIIHHEIPQNMGGLGPKKSLLDPDILLNCATTLVGTGCASRTCPFCP